jgi:CheY-like chemotaxis protein
MPKKILIVEDDEFLIDIMISRFSIEDEFEIVQAKDGKEALEKLHAHKIDLVLLDLVMPELDGASFLQQMRENPLYQYTPVIVLSNLSGQENVEQCVALGITDYLVKAHFTPTEVVDKIKKALNENRS